MVELKEGCNHMTWLVIASFYFDLIMLKCT
jgi:hypothetical protein